MSYLSLFREEPLQLLVALGGRQGGRAPDILVLQMQNIVISIIIAIIIRSIFIIIIISSSIFIIIVITMIVAISLALGAGPTPVAT